jgi:3-oxoacyl-[acyl-carrier protein] reductase
VLTKIFARELAPYGVTVNTVAPAAIRTPEMDKIAPEKLEKMVKGIPVGRVGESDEVARMVSFLASESAGYVTGATFDINGGLLMR